MKRMGWLAFAYVLLFLSSGAGSLKALQSAPPSTPTGFDGVAQSTTSIQWSWGPSTGSSQITYEIHATPETSPATIIVSGLTATTYLESGLNENTQYSRDVYAVASDGTKSLASNIGKRYTLIHTATTGDFSLSLPSNTSILVTVVEPPNAFADQTGVEIFRTVPTALQIRAFSQVYSGTDSGLQPKTQYCYNIQFRNGDGIPSGAGPSPLCITTPDEQIPCHWDISIQTSYGIADFVRDEQVLGTFAGRGGRPRPVSFGSNHFELDQQGTRIHHTLNMHRRSLGSATLDRPSQGRYSELNAFTETTMTIQYTGPQVPTLTANMGARIVLATNGERTGILGGGGWATAVVGDADGEGDVSYKIPPNFLASDSGGAEMIFVGGDIGPFFGGADISLPVVSDPQDKNLRKASNTTKSKKAFQFVFKNAGGISADVTPSTNGTVRTHGSGRFSHQVTTLHASDGNCAIDLTMDGDIALVTIVDDLGTRSFELRCPPALTSPGPDANFEGGQFVWTEGD